MISEFHIVTSTLSTICQIKEINVAGEILNCKICPICKSKTSFPILEVEKSCIILKWTFFAILIFAIIKKDISLALEQQEQHR